MKKKILIADKLIQPFEKVYKLKFNVECLWKIKTKNNSLEHEAVIVTGGFKTNKHFAKLLQTSGRFTHYFVKK